MRLTCLVFLLIFAPGVGSAFTVIVDPGHGGSDPGASRFGRKEADIALDVGRKIAQRLEEDSRFKVVLTRRSNKRLSLENRADLANREKGDLFISVHLNASTDERAQGVEFYLQNLLPADEESYFLATRENQTRSVAWKQESANAQNILSPTVATIVEDLHRNQRINDSDQLAKFLFANWHGINKKRSHSVKQAPFFLLANVNMPSLLIELGYLSHRQEAATLSEPQTQKKIAERIYAGVVKYKEMLDKQLR